MNRINAAYDSGPDLLIQTIEKDLGIQINHYVDIDFPGFTTMVNTLGGITLDFPTAVKDAYTGLYVTQTGCQNVNGVTALQLVRPGTSTTSTRRANGSTTASRTSAASNARTPSSAPCCRRRTRRSPTPWRSTRSSCRGGQRDDRRQLDRGRPLRHRHDLPRAVGDEPRDRDAADDVVRHRRWGRRPAGGPAVRAEHDRRLQRHRCQPDRHAGRRAPRTRGPRRPRRRSRTVRCTWTS